MDIVWRMRHQPVRLGFLSSSRRAPPLWPIWRRTPIGCPESCAPSTCTGRRPGRPAGLGSRNCAPLRRSWRNRRFECSISPAAFRHRRSSRESAESAYPERRSAAILGHSGLRSRWPALWSERETWRWCALELMLVPGLNRGWRCTDTRPSRRSQLSSPANWCRRSAWICWPADLRLARVWWDRRCPPADCYWCWSYVPDWCVRRFDTRPLGSAVLGRCSSAEERRRSHWKRFCRFRRLWWPTEVLCGWRTRKKLENSFAFLVWISKFERVGKLLWCN